MTSLSRTASPPVSVTTAAVLVALPALLLLVGAVIMFVQNPGNVVWSLAMLLLAALLTALAAGLWRGLRAAWFASWLVCGIAMLVAVIGGVSVLQWTEGALLAWGLVVLLLVTVPVSSRRHFAPSSIVD